MPQKGKKKGKSPNKAQSKSKAKTKQNVSKASKPTPASSKHVQPVSTSLTKRDGQAFSKEIHQILNQLTGILREVDQLKGSPLYETAIKIDEFCDQIINLQYGRSNSKQEIDATTVHQIWGFEDTHNVEQQIILNRLALWIKSKQTDSFMDDKFEFATGLREGRGVIAAKDLKQGEHAMSIHRDIMMTHGYAMNRSDEKIRRFLKKDTLCQNMPSLVLVLFVWYERMKGKKSMWKPYLDALPKWFGLPHECKIKDLIPFLRGSLILDKIIRLKISHLRHYTYSRLMLSRAGIEPGLRLVDYLWAAGVVMSRQNRIPSEHNAEESELALIPGWDMCNYKSGKITTYFNTTEQRNEMFVMNEVRKGEQIYIYYGGQRNELLYLNSGFVFDDNPNDELELDLRLELNDSLYALKALQIKNAKLTNPIKCLLPVLAYNKFQSEKEITLQTTLSDIEQKEKVQEIEETKVERQAESREFAENDVSTDWILSVFESKGLSIPSPSIRFARIKCMNNDEIKEFMQKILEQKKKEKDQKPEVISEDTVDVKETDEIDEANKVKKPEEIGEPKEVVNVENEMKAWNVMLEKAQRMYDFFTEKLQICVDVHIHGKNIDVDDYRPSSIQMETEEVVKKLREMNKPHVALTYDLLSIERKHYQEVRDVMKESLKIIERRLNKVLKGIDVGADDNESFVRLQLDESRITTV